jgi:hypothetical protein
MLDKRWVLLEEGYAHTLNLTKEEAEQLMDRYKKIYPNLDFSLFYDEYYEYSEIF